MGSKETIRKIVASCTYCTTNEIHYVLAKKRRTRDRRDREIQKLKQKKKQTKKENNKTIITMKRNYTTNNRVCNFDLYVDVMKLKSMSEIIPRSAHG